MAQAWNMRVWLGLGLSLGLLERTEAFGPLRMSLRAPAAAIEPQALPVPRPMGTPGESTVVVAGATGYIGRAVVESLASQGYQTVALVRPRPDDKPKPMFPSNVRVLEADVTDARALRAALADLPNGVQGGVSCLASRSGDKDDAFRIDYEATLDFVDAIRDAGAGHFVLLSAFCVRNPLLQFQHAKLKLEAALRERSDLRHAIVRPTAFFKSLTGQLEGIEQGAPFVIFTRDDGSSMRCNPIAEADLADYMVRCFQDVTLQNRVLDVGGPDEPLSMRQQGELLFEACGREPKFISVPIRLFDLIIGFAELVGKVNPGVARGAEFGRIGRYYAAEDMAVTGAGQQVGTVTLADHYKKAVEEDNDYGINFAFTKALASMAWLF